MGRKNRTRRQKNRDEKRKIGTTSGCRHSKPREKQAPQPQEWHSQIPAAPLVWVDRGAMDRFIRLVESNQLLETGGFLIGNLYRDPVSDKTIATVYDIYFDGKFGSPSDYVFGLEMQMSCYAYMKGKYGQNAHIVGTIHSHAQFEAFYSTTDYSMMNSRRSDEVHLVVSPSHRHYVVTYKDRDFRYHDDAELMPDSLGPVIGYDRRRL